MTIWDWIGSSLVLAGLIAVFVALVADRSYGRLRCRKCWYRMEQVPAADGARRCPECGRVHRRDRTLRRTRRHWGWALVAIAIVCGGYLVTRTPHIRSRGWIAGVPTTVLMTVAPPFDWIPAFTGMEAPEDRPPPAAWRMRAARELLLERLDRRDGAFRWQHDLWWRRVEQTAARVSERHLRAGQWDKWTVRHVALDRLLSEEWWRLDREFTGSDRELLKLNGADELVLSLATELAGSDVDTFQQSVLRLHYPSDGVLLVGEPNAVASTAYAIEALKATSDLSPGSAVEFPLTPGVAASLPAPFDWRLVIYDVSDLYPPGVAWDGEPVPEELNGVSLSGGLGPPFRVTRPRDLRLAMESDLGRRTSNLREEVLARLGVTATEAQGRDEVTLLAVEDAPGRLFVLAPHEVQAMVGRMLEDLRRRTSDPQGLLRAARVRLVWPEAE